MNNSAAKRRELLQLTPNTFRNYYDFCTACKLQYINLFQTQYSICKILKSRKKNLHSVMNSLHTLTHVVFQTKWSMKRQHKINRNTSLNHHHVFIFISATGSSIKTINLTNNGNGSQTRQFKVIFCLQWLCKWFGQPEHILTISKSIINFITRLVFYVDTMVQSHRFMARRLKTGSFCIRQHTPLRCHRHRQGGASSWLFELNWPLVRNSTSKVSL